MRKPESVPRLMGCKLSNPLKDHLEHWIVVGGWNVARLIRSE